MVMRYEDNSMSEVMTSSETIGKLKEMSEVGQFPKAVYFGTHDEIKKVVSLDDLTSKVIALENKIEEKDEKHLAFNKAGLHIPTLDEVEKITKEIK
jgi:hypothetical protein